MKKKLWILTITLLLAAALGLSGCGSDDSGKGDAAKGDSVTWKVQCAYPQGDQAYDIHMPMICEAITEATDGYINFEYYAPGALCEAEQAPASVSKGLLDCAISAPNDTATLVPAAYAEQGIPYWWATKENIYECFYDYGLIDYLREEYAKQNIYYGLFNGEGQYMLMTNFPVKSASDLKGKKIRASTSYATMMEQLGASPVTMSGGDIYMGMKLGTIDGYIYTVSELETSSLKEVTSDVMEPAGCAGAPVNFIINMDKWNSLPEDIQKKVNDTMQELCLTTMDAAIDLDEKSIKSAKDYGVEFNTVSDKEMEDFYKAGEAVLEKLTKKYPDAKKGFEIISKWKDESDAQ
ncbi:MAG: TRAP transporter substrate-binding protein DctP [Firmicutes bacterium]|nr:TRAP transporter substrate-binding protein DctP [Bacillota bacterium]